jgi:hypothetical protein
MDYYENGVVQSSKLSWSSPSTQKQSFRRPSSIRSQPAPGVSLTEPANGSSYTASATVTITANAAAQYNTLQKVEFYANATFLVRL